MLTRNNNVHGIFIKNYGVKCNCKMTTLYCIKTRDFERVHRYATTHAEKLVEGLDLTCGDWGSHRIEYTKLGGECLPGPVFIHVSDDSRPEQSGFVLHRGE